MISNTDLNGLIGACDAIAPQIEARFKAFLADAKKALLELRSLRHIECVSCYKCVKCNVKPEDRAAPCPVIDSNPREKCSSCVYF